MCDHSNRLIAVWNGQPSRTANTIRYTQKIGIEVVFSNRTHGSIKFKYGDSLPDCDKVWHLFCSQDRKIKLVDVYPPDRKNGSQN